MKVIRTPFGQMTSDSGTISGVVASRTPFGATTTRVWQKGVFVAFPNTGGKVAKVVS